MASDLAGDSRRAARGLGAREAEDGPAVHQGCRSGRMVRPRTSLPAARGRRGYAACSGFADRHGFWGCGHRYPPSEAEISRFCNQHSSQRCRLSRSAGQRQSLFLRLVARCQAAKSHNNAQPQSVTVSHFRHCPGARLRIRGRLQHRLQAGHGLFAPAIQPRPESGSPFTERGGLDRGLMSTQTPRSGSLPVSHPRGTGTMRPWSGPPERWGRSRPEVEGFASSSSPVPWSSRGGRTSPVIREDQETVALTAMLRADAPTRVGMGLAGHWVAGSL